MAISRTKTVKIKAAKIQAQTINSVFPTKDSGATPVDGRTWEEVDAFLHNRGSSLKKEVDRMRAQAPAKKKKKKS
jgi:hypothetical protein